MKLWITRVLLIFVLVSIGFSLGKHSAGVANSPEGAETQAQAIVSAEAPGKVLHLYSAHMTYRCFDCSSIQAITKELLDTEFSHELESGKIIYHAIDYIKNPEFSGKYDVSASTVVLVLRSGDADIDYERLDGVWTRLGNTDVMKAYIRAPVQKFLTRITDKAGG